MAELELVRDQRLALRARAHHLEPVVLLGAQGLSEAVLKEIDRALAAHELIKVRAPIEDRTEREELFLQMAQRLAAARIVHIGKLLVLYRPRPAEPETKHAAPMRTTDNNRDKGRIHGPQASRERRNDRRNDRHTNSQPRGRGR